MYQHLLRDYIYQVQMNPLPDRIIMQSLFGFISSLCLLKIILKDNVILE